MFMSLGKFFKKVFHISKEDKRELRKMAKETAVDLALDRINKKLNKKDSSKQSDEERNLVRMSSEQLDRLYEEMNEYLKSKEKQNID